MSLFLVFFLMIRRPPRSTRTDTLFPYTTLFRSLARGEGYNRAAAMQRKFGLLEDVPFDDGGRFFISPFLKKLCSIDDIVFINGSGDYFELWNPQVLLATDGVYDALKLAAEFALEEWEKNPKNPKRRSEEHTSELQSLMRTSYAVFCLKKKTKLT